jgi:hypothetical protein
MKRMMILIAIGVALTGCGEREPTGTREAGTFEVIEEGAGGQVTSTLGDAGVPPVTNTNVDTTTAFTILQPAPPIDTSATSVAGQIPGVPPAQSPTYTPPPTSTSSQPRPGTIDLRPSRPAPRPTAPSPAPTQPSPVPPTDTAAPVEPVETPAPPTETVEAPEEPVEPEPEEDESESEEPPPPPPPPSGVESSL